MHRSSPQKKRTRQTEPQNKMLLLPCQPVKTEKPPSVSTQPEPMFYQPIAKRRTEPIMTYPVLMPSFM